jgi:hypothetical protein
MIKKFVFLSLVIFSLNKTVVAQDWLDSLSNTGNSTIYTSATFKTTRIINTHTLETLGKRTLDFRISHRFAPINNGAYNLWGLDGPATIRLSLEYSYDGRLMAGLGRSSLEKMWDGFLKYRLYRQTDDDKHPLSVTLFSGMYYTSLNDPNKELNGFDKYEFQTSRMSYAFEVIAGRKFNSKFSFQVAPFLVHYNLVDNFTDRNDVYGVSGGLRYKFSKRSAITAEYSYCINDYSQSTYYNSLGIGYELETGGHVFQIHFTNSAGMVENQFLAHTTDKWSNAGIRLGFNISRVFRL